jgi:DNA-binding CsgD family transcriptional regulator/tetratricopeptide (TPR) repeat protein
MLFEREQARSRLEAALRAARSGAGRIVSLEGEAGIGKTSAALDFVEAHRTDARVFLGGCENLSTPEPLGPLRDIERDSRGRFTVSATSQLATFESLLRLLTSHSEPGLLLVEDLHWADDPTLDLFRYLGRRIRSARLLVIVTFRNDEAPSQARLAALWSDMPVDCRDRIELERLSASAVSKLSADVGWVSPGEVYSITGGNPFYVTEYLATGRAAVPRTVRDATLARTIQLSAGARRTLDCASIFPRHINQSVLRELTQDINDQGVEECMRAGMLSVTGDVLSFRHELARRAIHEAMSPLRRRELHAAALQLLGSQQGIRAAELVHHAQEAGSARDLVRYALRAADEAHSIGAHRESVAHFARALQQGSWLTNAERASILQRQAEAGEASGAFAEAINAIQEAIIARKYAGDMLGLGDALRISARIHWMNGDSRLAEEESAEALEVLRDHPRAPEYAMALSSQSQLDMLADRPEAAIPRAQQAMALAESLNRWDIYFHASTNLTAARSSLDVVTGSEQILEGIRAARRRNQLDLLPRMYVSLVYMMTHDRRFQHLFEYFEEGINAAIARDNAPLEAYIRGSRALALLDMGRIQEAITESEFVVFGPYSRGTAGFTARIALARARIRTGIPEGDVLDEARSWTTSQRDIMRRAPLAVVDAEALWLGLARPGALERLRAAYAQAHLGQGSLWNLADTALWLKILGEPIANLSNTTPRVRTPYQAHLKGNWREAATAWSDLGCPYEQAIALADGDEPAQREALTLFGRLGATPAAARLRRHMRAVGVNEIPRGPIAKTRANPAGLTGRQSQVLTLLIKGHSNGQIARRLNISSKTVEHHVAAIMARLEITTRREALNAARERGLLDSPQE